MANDRVVVPIEDTATLRSTVAHVVGTAADGDVSAIHFVYLAAWREDDPRIDDRRRTARTLLEQAADWARYDLADADVPEGTVDVETALIAEDVYLFGPRQYADRLHEYADAHGIGTVVLDPEYTPVGNTTLLQPMEFELASTPLEVREAPVDRPSRRERLVSEITGPRFATVFGGSLLFYLVLGDPTSPFDLVTGVATALVVAISLSQVSLDHDPTLRDSPLRLVRGVIYVPFLFFEIMKSNVVVARVILSPSLPIEPTMTRMRVFVGSGLPVTTLANSITLTPGTLTVRARDADLYVHTLIPWAREGLFDGGLERWTRFVFYGREAARLPTPRERDDCAVLQGPDADEPMPFAATDGGREEGLNGIDADETVVEADADETGSNETDETEDRR
ncbi:monovalent cation/H+ antiporter subunit E [Halopenitus persicus]|uniref:Multisubunit sodium/proton antiporter, MrpE subunit n=1 Tax=Halopenitus persicus TaxID=1048396 RepID=A0A1H3HH57_9EURY|nr:monovalent cation/H+ antiporter subunit E [Halopenitus persicus]SDY14009.1 multisubunit sodium/proton antiporter, MrpE subunit [Halopenitus persicus]